MRARWLQILLALAVGVPLAAADPRPRVEWWRDAVIYAAVEGLRGDGFAGVEEHLPDLAALGVTAILLWPPIALRADGEEYAIVDHAELDPSWGSERDLHALVDSAHGLGLRVLIDVVLNHTSDLHPWFREAQRDGLTSPAWDRYSRDGRDATYEFDWTHLPNLDLDHPDVRAELIGTTVDWLVEYDLDGARLDAAWALGQRSTTFVRDLAAAVRQVRPDALLIAEAPPGDDAVRDGLPVAYDWTRSLGEWAWERAFAAPARDRPRLLGAALEDRRAAGALTLRFINTNDSGPRFLERHGRAQTRLAAALQFTVPGVPLIFGGDEVGAAYEPYSDRAGVDWSDPGGMAAWYEDLIALRSQHAALRHGSLDLLVAERGILAYARRLESGSSALVVAFNFGPAQASMPLEPAGQVVFGEAQRDDDGIILAPESMAVLRMAGADGGTETGMHGDR